MRSDRHANKYLRVQLHDGFNRVRIAQIDFESALDIALDLSLSGDKAAYSAALDGVRRNLDRYVREQAALTKLLNGTCDSLYLAEALKV